MTHRVLCALVATAALAVARPAAAQAHDVGDWSILGAETVKPGSDVIYGAFGWPDASFGFTHGMNPNFDLGFRFSLVYGVENTTTSQFGIAAAMPLRWAFGRPGNVHLLFHFDPGLRLYTYDPTPFGFQFPVGLNLEFLTRAPFKFGLGADFNMSLFVTGAGVRVRAALRAVPRVPRRPAARHRLRHALRGDHRRRFLAQRDRDALRLPRPAAARLPPLIEARRAHLRATGAWARRPVRAILRGCQRGGRTWC